MNRTASPKIDVAANRAAVKWTRRELAGRVLWGLAHPLFALSPRPLWWWRRALLRAFGARVGRDVHVFPSVRITIPWNLVLKDQCAIGDRVILYALGPITVGARTAISQGAHLCAGTHDWRDLSMPLKKKPIVVDDDVWIAADAFIGPGIVVGRFAIVGARAVCMTDVETNTVVAGNPAMTVSKRFAADPPDVSGLPE